MTKPIIFYGFFDLWRQPAEPINPTNEPTGDSVHKKPPQKSTRQKNHESTISFNIIRHTQHYFDGFLGGSPSLENDFLHHTKTTPPLSNTLWNRTRRSYGGSRNSHAWQLVLFRNRWLPTLRSLLVPEDSNLRDRHHKHSSAF